LVASGSLRFGLGRAWGSLVSEPGVLVSKPGFLVSESGFLVPNEGATSRTHLH